jgi:hypothetical protein
MDSPHLAGAVVCRCIRSKGASVIYGEPTQWESGYYPTAVFWCLNTAGPVGPDDGFVHPHVCVAGRDCFREPLLIRSQAAG